MKPPGDRIAWIEHCHAPGGCGHELYLMDGIDIRRYFYFDHPVSESEEDVEGLVKRMMSMGYNPKDWRIRLDLCVVKTCGQKEESE